MYVCICNGVTEAAIREAMAAGCRSVDELTLRTGCGSTCGCCLTLAAELLDEPTPSAPSQQASPLPATQPAMI